MHNKLAYLGVSEVFIGVGSPERFPIWVSSSIRFILKQMAQQSGVNVTTDKNLISTSYQMTISGFGITKTLTFALVSSDTLNMTLNPGGVILDLDGFVKQ